MLSRFDMIPERDGQTDGRTDRIAISISRVSVPMRDKNRLRTTCVCLAVASEQERCHDSMAGLPWGLNFNPHKHPTPIPMGIPIPTAALVYIHLLLIAYKLLN